MRWMSLINNSFNSNSPDGTNLKFTPNKVAKINEFPNERLADRIESAAVYTSPRKRSARIASKLFVKLGYRKERIEIT